MGDRIVVMNGGRIRQAAAPDEVYNRPADRFVASFIGTPPMNFFPPGTLDFGRTTGLRPEHFSVVPVEGAPADAVMATVDIVEPLGSETIVHVVADLGRTPVAVRLPGDARVRHGERIALVADMPRAVYFDREGNRL